MFDNDVGVICNIPCQQLLEINPKYSNIHVNFRKINKLWHKKQTPGNTNLDNVMHLMINESHFPMKRYEAYQTGNE